MISHVHVPPFSSASGLCISPVHVFCLGMWVQEYACIIMNFCSRTLVLHCLHVIMTRWNLWAEPTSTEAAANRWWWTTVLCARQRHTL